MGKGTYTSNYHEHTAETVWTSIALYHWDTQFTYTFENFFHPFVGKLISKLNKESLPGMLDAKWQDSLAHKFFDSLYQPTQDDLVQVESFPKEIDVAVGGPYANYNWELLFHIPLTIAVHLSKTQRFAEAQRWFHYIFDPTSNDKSVDPPMRFWKFLAFRKPEAGNIDEILKLLSIPRNELPPAAQLQQDRVLIGYQAALDKPFQPHVVARTRPLAYQYMVVMKYLDNLIAWGDYLFQQDTVESINEATQRYVLAANLLGPRPQRIPPRGTVQAKTFKQLKDEGLGPIGNALVNLEGQFPFNLAQPDAGASNGDGDSSETLFGIGRTLYFCIPRNEKLLSYWDTVADRLFKIRNCMNIEGIVRPLALFDPPIDPGMLVKAAAAGIDISSIVSGLNQPIGPVRCLGLIQKALELCGEVRSLGGALLSALEKGDGEHLALVRQRHEIKIQQMTQEVRFLQWQSAREATTSLLTSRATAIERLNYYKRQLGLPADQNAPDTLPLDHSELTEENFDDAYSSLVGQYDKALTLQKLSDLKLAGANSPAQQSGASGQGRLYLNVNENAELNDHLPAARDLRLAASAADLISGGMAFVPDFALNLQFWGMGATTEVFGGKKLSDAGRFASEILRTKSNWEQDQAGMASRTAGHERHADELLLQYNLAAHELMQFGRQILTSLITEQITHHDYLNLKQQIANSQEVDQLLHDKFTNEELYLWMQGEISRLYYEYYRFAFDTARKAERTMKQELMRPELDAQDFVKFNYWDGGRKGLLSGEALHLDVKRMEMAYHENNKREYELIRHVSLRQLNPLALLTLKATGTCQVTIPEWLYDRDCPGHYMRRIKSVSLSLPSVVGPYTSVNCTLSLLSSSLRKSPLPKDGEYARQPEDDRFVDYIGAVQSIVTSAASNDSGMFETNLRDERFLPFEGAGAQSTWKIALPASYPAFDYATISDVILHIRYTARQGVDPTKVNKALDELLQQASQANLALLFSLRHDFPTEWSAFVNGADFTVTIRKDYFPYFTQGKAITIAGLELYGQKVTKHHAVGDTDAAATALEEDGQFTLTSGPDVTGSNRVLTRDAGQVFLVIRYSL
jgi:Tc toxin complex TcA C-terminal TcB-binding domain